LGGRHLLWLGRGDVRKSDAGRARKCRCELFGCYRATACICSNEPAPAEFSEKTIAYAQAKTALREAMPELINVATGKESRPAQLDKYSAAFSIAGEKQEKAADYCCETRATARIRHPNVALVSGLGRNVQNYFYAMEFV